MSCHFNHSQVFAYSLVSFFKKIFRSMNNNHLISIIVPVYNVERYIDRCIKSITKQTYNNWELLLIDDGSTDNSGKICDLYSKKNSRIRTIHTPNQGRSNARNLGIDKASGEWIAFVDSDDFVSPRYLESMTNANPTWDKEILISQGFHAITADGNYDTNYPEAFYHNYEINTYKQSNLHLISQYSLLHRQAVWGRLLNKEIITRYKIKFNPQIHHSEDGLFLHQYMLYTQCFKFISNQEYYYVTPILKSEKLNFEEIFYLAQNYQKLVIPLIKHFNIKDRTYKKRILDMYFARLSILLFDKKCPKNLKIKAQKFSIKALILRPVQTFQDFKLIIKYIILNFQHI